MALVRKEEMLCQRVISPLSCPVMIRSLAGQTTSEEMAVVLAEQRVWICSPG
jgi:hypothetical protein